MRRFLFLLLFFLSLCLALTLTPLALPSLSSPSVKEEPYEDPSQDLWQAFSSLTEQMGQGELGEEEALESAVGFEYLFSLVSEGLTQGYTPALGLFFTLMGITLLGSLMSLLSRESPSLSAPLGALVGVVCSLCFYRTVSGSLTRLTATLSDLTHLMEGLSPILGGILLGGGATGSATVTTAAFSTLLLLLEMLCNHLLLPLIGVCFSLSLLGSLGQKVHPEGVHRQLRGLFLTLLGFLGVVLAGAFSLQSILASTKDTLALRTAKYALGNMIPIIGGTLGAGVGTLGAALESVKSGVGVGGILLVLCLTLPTVIELWLMRAAVDLSCGFARMLGFDTGERLLKEFRGIYDMALAVAAFAALSFILFLAVFLKTALPMGAGL